MLDDRRRAEAEVVSTMPGIHRGMQRRHPLHMALVDHRVGPGRARGVIVLPVERAPSHDAARQVRSGVHAVPAQGMATMLRDLH